MTACLAILKRSLLGIVRNRSTLIWMLALPIVFTFVFGILPNAGGSAKLNISVVDNDHSTVSRGLIQEMKQDADYKVQVISSSQATSELRNLKADVIITLPQGLQKQALAHQSLVIDTTASPNEGASDSNSSIADLQNQINEWALAGNVGLLKETAHTHLDTQQSAQTFVQSMAQAKHIQAPISTTTNTLSGGKPAHNPLTDTERSVIGFAVMFIIFTLFGSTGNILEEKMSGTWSRMKMTPVSRAGVITGYGLSYFFIGWIQYILMTLSGRLMFGVDVPFNGWIALTVSLYIFAMAGFALCIAGLVKTQEQHMIIGSGIGSISSMIAGIYWPLDLEPQWMQHLAWLMPQSWALNAVQTAAMSNVTLAVIVWPLTVLAGFAVVFFSVGMVQLRYA
jgi:ABC-2 type transport system permease protein